MSDQLITDEISKPQILPLAEAAGARTGGKARGLARLIGLGLRVPAGFVVSGACPGKLPDELGEAYRRLGGGSVAVRSSAEAEDGTTHSYAGQFESVLGVEGEGPLREAVERCLASLHRATAQAYARERGGAGAMNVVVQRMVQPRAAGVLFTVDPVRRARDRVVVDAVPGLGDALVSGRESPDHYELSREGELVNRELRGESAILSERELRRLVEEALRAEDALGSPLDMEWAIDGEGELHWLQARPVTALSAEPGDGDLDLHELDTPAVADHVYTRANIGEMLPGPACPLTISTTVYGVDRAIQRIHVSSGVAREYEDHLPLVKVFFGHLFFDLTALSELTRTVLGSTPQQMCFAICGRPIPELRVDPPAPALTRALNGLRYFRYVLGGRFEVDRFERRLARFELRIPSTAAELYAELDAKLPFLFDGYDMHLRSSASSGVTHGVLEGVLGKGGPPTPEHDAVLAGWLQSSGDLRSSSLVTELEEVLGILDATPDAEAALLAATPDRALEWLRGPQAGKAGRAFERYLERQGHRGPAELSMQQPAWADDPLPLVQSLQALLAARRRASEGERQSVAGVQRPAPALRALVAWARSSVRQRERSKELLVRVSHRFKRAYWQLGERLASEGLLPDADLYLFLTHRELGHLIIGRDPSLAARAARRRLAQRRQAELEFPDVFVGAPAPLQPAVGGDVGTLQGRPVSRGVARGRARVVRTLEEASDLRPGEILVAPITDVGWSPYFKLIAGLATDVGSSISHGAVLARECGVPAVVNLRVATKTFRTGDLVVLDGNQGTLSRR